MTIEEKLDKEFESLMDEIDSPDDFCDTEKIKQFISQNYIPKERIINMLFECYPPDMENFSTMTQDQAYRLLKCFWEKIK